MLFRRGNFFIHPESAVEHLKAELTDKRGRVPDQRELERYGRQGSERLLRLRHPSGPPQAVKP